MKKVGNILLNILIVVVVLVALGMSVMVISSKATGVPNVFGYSPVTVQSDSMSGTFEKGDLLIIQKVNVNDLKIGDVITFKETINNVEILNTHRIVNVIMDGTLPAYVTKGDHEKEKDIMPVRQGDVVGKWTEKKVPVLGKVMDFIKSQAGIMVCFVIPLALLFIWQLYKFISLLGENKKQKALEEVTAGIEDEKKKAIEEYIAAQKAQQEAEAVVAAKVGHVRVNTEDAPPAEEDRIKVTDNVGQVRVPSAEDSTAAEDIPPAEATPVEADPKEAGPELTPADDEQKTAGPIIAPAKETTAGETPTE